MSYDNNDVEEKGKLKKLLVTLIFFRDSYLLTFYEIEDEEYEKNFEKKRRFNFIGV
jgi:hypothetical protein